MVGSVAAVLVVAGVVVLVGDAVRRRAGGAAAGAGLALAGAWAGGELLVRAGVDGGVSSLEVTFTALWTSLVVVVARVAVALVGAAVRGRGRAWAGALVPGRAHVAFAVHGAVSFAGAYALYFDAVAGLGLAGTVVVTVWWPTLALAVNWAWARRHGRPYPVNRALVCALALFTAAGVGYTAGRLLV